MLAFGGPNGDSWSQVLDLAAAFVLCAIIGLDRELRHKDAGLRTMTMVGVASALFMQVSKFGFGDVLPYNHISLDPSRVASLVVSGIGFLGAGLIFVQRGDVRGLTTASTAWLVAAVGLACGADLIALAAILTGIYLVIVVGFSAVVKPTRRHELRVRFSGATADAGDVVMRRCREKNFAVLGFKTERGADGFTVTTVVEGIPPIEDLYAAMRDVGEIEMIAVDARELSPS
jgi:putative Mg2+ transporter-C (MgtC) family protein